MQDRITPENYSEKRAELVEQNINTLVVLLTEEETRVGAVLEQLKEDYRAACGGNIPYSMPMLSDERIWNSLLYQFCRELPKGSDLHVHGFAMLPAWKLIEFLEKRDDVLLSVEAGPEFGKLRLPSEFDEIPLGIMSFSDALSSGAVTKKQLLQVWTLHDAEVYQDIWEHFEELFLLHRSLQKDRTIVFDYYVEAFRYYLSRNVFHVEIHQLLKGTLEDNLRMVETIRDAYYTVKKERPEFVVSLIGAGPKFKGVSPQATENSLVSTLEAMRLYKDDFDPEHVVNFVIGFDLVNEEDRSTPLRDFAPLFLEYKWANPELEFFFHCGESLDAASDNLIDAYLLGTKRVGHGLNLYRYPELLKLYRANGIALEVCPVSNQTLRYTTDVRVHPAVEYLKRGVTIALGSDDPVYQEHETLVDDFFAAIIGWGLGIAEIKQLCLNSIYYSGLNRRQKHHLQDDWLEAWNEFIERWSSLAME